MPESPAKSRSGRSVSRGRSPTKKPAAKKSPGKKSPGRPSKKVSKSPAKKRATSKTPKKTRGRSKSVTKTPAKKTPARSASRGRSKTPSRTPAAKNTPQKAASAAASAIKVSVNKIASVASKSAKSATPSTNYGPSANGRALRKRFDHSVGAESGSGYTKAKQSTVGSLLASVRGYQSPASRTRSKTKWYMYNGYNLFVLAFFFSILIALLASGYHYRQEVNAQFNRLRARGQTWYNRN